PSGAQKPSLAHVVPPSSASTTASTPTEKSLLEMSCALQSPNAPAMTNIAAGKARTTVRTHPRSARADVTPGAGAGDAERERGAHRHPHEQDRTHRRTGGGR